MIQSNLIAVYVTKVGSGNLQFFLFNFIGINLFCIFEGLQSALLINCWYSRFCNGWY